MGHYPLGKWADAFGQHWPRILAAVLLLAYIPFLRHQIRPADVHGGQPGIIRRFAVTRRVVALAFDDGPNSVVTPAVIQDLQQYHDHASFFVVSRNLADERSLLTLAVRAGDEVESHTAGHINLTAHSYEQDLADLGVSNRTIQRATGVRPVWLSPPYGAVNAIALRAARTRHLTIVLPSPGERVLDNTPSVNAIVQQVMSHIEPGDIIVMHDDAGNTASLRALPIILSLLKVEGYRVGTVSWLAQMAQGTR